MEIPTRGGLLEGVAMLSVLLVSSAVSLKLRSRILGPLANRVTWEINAKVERMKGEFVKSAIAAAGYPRWRLPEIAFVGRSNVGKSSLINHLLKEKLAKTSATPGKTQLLNFFSIEDKFAFVDLPGYGYARVPGQVRREWSQALENYLVNRENLRLILLLLDIRRAPSANDQAFAEWAAFHNKPLLLVFTKCDKVKAHEKNRNTAIYLQTFQNVPYIHYTIKEEGTRRALLAQLCALKSEGRDPESSLR